MRKIPKNRTKAVSSVSDVNIHALPIPTARERAWPFTPEDTAPLAWWRTLPSDLWRDAEALLAYATLDEIGIVGGSSAFAAALCGCTAAGHHGGILADADRRGHARGRPRHDGGAARCAGRRCRCRARAVARHRQRRAPLSLCNGAFGVLARPSPPSLPSHHCLTEEEARLWYALRTQNEPTAADKRKQP
jgi:hypothetical protein